MPVLLKTANLALAFLLELAALAAFAYWGFTTGESTLVRIVLGVAVTLLAAALWGFFAAPRSTLRLRGAAFLGFKIVFFALAVAALLAVGQPTLAAVLAAGFVINTILAYVWHQE